MDKIILLSNAGNRNIKISYNITGIEKIKLKNNPIDILVIKIEVGLEIWRATSDFSIIPEIGLISKSKILKGFTAIYNNQPILKILMFT